MVFISKKSNQVAETDLTVAGLRGVKTKPGNVGIEVECEGTHLPKPPGAAGTHTPTVMPGSKFWSYVHDGSLRGRDNAEYVLTKPIEFDEVSNAVDELWAIFKKGGAKLEESTRTSVHVHLNVLPFYQNRLASLLSLWFIFEELLSEWCGEHRAGNLYCLRAKDGPVIIEQIKEWFDKRGHVPLDTEGLHYAALNLAALTQHGSVEVRTMRGVTEPKPLLTWVGILQKLYEASAEYPDPRRIIEDFSALGPYEFIEKVFGKYANDILNETKNIDLKTSLFEGMRFSQELAYIRDWSYFNPIKTVEDPFGRRVKPTSTTTTLNAAAELRVDGGVWNEPFFQPEPDFARERFEEIARRAPARPRVFQGRTVRGTTLNG